MGYKQAIFTVKKLQSEIKIHTKEFETAKNGV